MSENVRDLGELEERVRRFRDAREWRRFHRPKDLAVSVTLEAAELLEVFQWKDRGEVDREMATEAGREAVAHEMADILILLLSLADVLTVDLHAAVLDKLVVNEARYPVDKARGTARKYDKL